MINTSIFDLDGTLLNSEKGNACDEVKRAAKYILKSNDEDGIYFTLKEILHLID